MRPIGEAQGLPNRGIKAGDVDANGGQRTQIREAWQTGTPLDRFKEQVQAMVGRTIGQARRGRPKKTPSNIL
ncbi:MAG: hypothetical protein ACREXU_02065 [Gammaproteobacteria bacterium]